MSDRDVDKVRSKDDMYSMMAFIIQRIHSTPSMVDKLPKYLMERVERVVEYSNKHGW